MKSRFVTRARMDRELDAVREAARQEAEQEAARYVGKLAEAAAANIRLSGRIKALNGQGKTLTASDVLEQHDVHRKGIADALGDQKYHLNWDQLIAEVASTRKAAIEWMADATRLNEQLTEAEKRARGMTSEEWQERPVDGAPAGRREPSAELLREQGLARDLSARLAEVQAANMRCTCSRQGAVS